MPARIAMALHRNLRLIAAPCAALALAACGDDSTSNPDGSEAPSRATVSLENAVSGVPLQAGQTTHHVSMLHVPADFRTLQAADLDVQATMAGVRLEDLPAPSLARAVAARLGAASMGAVTAMRVGPDPETVCSDGILYGPFTAAFSESLTVDPPTAAMDGPTLRSSTPGPSPSA